MNFETGRIDCKDSAIGKMEQTVKEQTENQLIELQKLRQDFDKYVTEQEAKQKAAEDRKKLDKRINIIVTVVASSISGIIAGIFVYYWPSIVSAVRCLFHG